MVSEGSCAYACTVAGGGTEEDHAWLAHGYAAMGCGDLPIEEQGPPTIADVAAQCPTQAAPCLATPSCLAELEVALASEGNVRPGSDAFNAIGHCFMSQGPCGENRYRCWMDDACDVVQDMDSDSAEGRAARTQAGQALGIAQASTQAHYEAV